MLALLGLSSALLLEAEVRAEPGPGLSSLVDLKAATTMMTSGQQWERFVFPQIPNGQDSGHDIFRPETDRGCTDTGSPAADSSDPNRFAACETVLSDYWHNGQPLAGLASDADLTRDTNPHYGPPHVADGVPKVLFLHTHGLREAWDTDQCSVGEGLSRAGEGYTCAWYVKTGACVNPKWRNNTLYQPGLAAPQLPSDEPPCLNRLMHEEFGPEFNSPEEHCCACGKGLPSPRDCTVDEVRSVYGPSFGSLPAVVVHVFDHAEGKIFSNLASAQRYFDSNHHKPARRGELAMRLYDPSQSGAGQSGAACRSSKHESCVGQYGWMQPREWQELDDWYSNYVGKAVQEAPPAASRSVADRPPATEPAKLPAAKKDVTVTVQVTVGSKDSNLRGA